jgi:hypothetical protein
MAYLKRQARGSRWVVEPLGFTGTAEPKKRCVLMELSGADLDNVAQTIMGEDSAAGGLCS